MVDIQTQDFLVKSLFCFLYYTRPPLSKGKAWAFVEEEFQEI